MKRFLAADGADVNRHVPAGAEHLGLKIGSGYIHQSARAQLVMLERFHIGPQRDIVVNARRHVTPMRRRKGFASQRFKVHHAQRIFCVGDDGRVLRPGLGN